MFDIFVPLFEQTLIELGAIGAGVGDDLALGERGHQLLGQPPLQDPAERHGDDIVEIDFVEGDDLVRHRGPERGDAARLHGDALAANQVGERAAIEKIDFDFVVPIGPLHLPRLPDFAGETVGREVAATVVEVAQSLGVSGERLRGAAIFFLAAGGDISRCETDAGHDRPKTSENSRKTRNAGPTRRQPVNGQTSV